MKILGVRCRELGPGVLCGRVAQIVVEAAHTRASGWRIVARDLRDDSVIAHGVGADLESAEADAQDDFAERMARRFRSAA